MRAPLLALLAISAAVAQAQAPGRTGVSVGASAQFVGTTYLFGDSLFIEQGPGFGVRADVGVTSEIAVFLSGGRARIRTADGAVGPIRLNTLDVGVHVDAPGPQRAIEPYVRLAVTLLSAAADAAATGPGAAPGATERLTARGAGGSVGFGLLFAVAPRLALDLSADVTVASVGALLPEGGEGPGCACARTARIGLGLVFTP